MALAKKTTFRETAYMGSVTGHRFVIRIRHRCQGGGGDPLGSLIYHDQREMKIQTNITDSRDVREKTLTLRGQAFG